MNRAPKKLGYDGYVVHFVLSKHSSIAFCSWSKDVSEHIENVQGPLLPHETPVTCLACLVDAEEVY